MDVDAEALLTEAGISYVSSGKNIGANGWIGIDCPRCSDQSNHCAIVPSGTNWTCWSCGGKGSITKAIQVLGMLPYNTAAELVKKYSNKFHHETDIEFQNVPEVVLPGTPKLSTQTKRYLRNRGLSPLYLQQNYGVVDGGTDGKYKFRVIIPVYMNNTLVTYIARDVTGRQELRYKNLPAHESKLPTKQVIYNWDNIHKRAVVCEGAFDSWAIGLDACAVLGTAMSDAQIKLLSTLDEAIILFDNSKKAQARAEKLDCVLSFCGVDSKVALLPEGVDDPGEMSTEQVNHFRYNYLGG